MGDISKTTSVISDQHDQAICTVSAVSKDQIFRQPSTGTTYSMGQQIVFNAELEQTNRMLDDIGFRYNFTNTHATANMYVFNGWWNFIDRLELRCNGSIIGDFPLGSVNLMQLGKFNNYEQWDQYIADRWGSFGQSANFDNEPYPSSFRFPVVNGTSGRFESYLSEIVKCFYKQHVKYIRNFQIIVYLKNTTNPHKICGFDAGFTFANFTFTNVEMVLYFTNYKENNMPVNILPKITFHEEFYEDKVFDVTNFAGQVSVLQIRLDTQYRQFMNIKKIFIWTDNTATNGTYDTTTSYPLFHNQDVTQIEILHNGLRYAIYDSLKGLLIHQQKYHKRRSRRRAQNWLTYNQFNQVPCNFISMDRDDLIISNDGHHKVNFISGISNQVNLSGEWQLRITGGWSAVRPNLHVCLEVTHLICLFSDPNNNAYFQQ